MDIPGRPDFLFLFFFLIFFETEAELIWGRGEVEGGNGRSEKSRKCGCDAMFERRIKILKNQILAKGP